MSEPAAFAYSKGIAPMMWVFVALAGIELLVVHLLLSFWSPTAALVLSAITLLSMLWMVALIRSFGRLPVLVGEQGVTMRVGSLNTIQVPRDHVAGVRQSFPSDALKQPDGVSLALIAYPNVILDLEPPLESGKRRIRSIAHCLEDPAGFARAVGALLQEPAAHQQPFRS